MGRHATAPSHAAPVFAAEHAIVRRVLRHLHLLDHFADGGAISCAILSCDPDLLRALAHGVVAVERTPMTEPGPKQRVNAAHFVDMRGVQENGERGMQHHKGRLPVSVIREEAMVTPHGKGREESRESHGKPGGRWVSARHKFKEVPEDGQRQHARAATERLDQ